MLNYIRTLLVAGIITSAVSLGVMPAHAVTYYWCPASAGAIVCNNCTVNITCDISGFPITIKGNYVTLNGQGHSVSNYSSTSSAGVNDSGTGTIISNIYVYFSGLGIWINQAGNVNGFKDIRNVGVYGTTTYGLYVEGVHSQAAKPQSVNVTDSWVYGAGYSGFQTVGDVALGEAGAPLASFERITANYNLYGFRSYRGNTNVYNSNFSGNSLEGVSTLFNLHGQIFGTTADNNGRYGFRLDDDNDFVIAQNYGHGNGGSHDCLSSWGSYWGIWNDFGRSSGAGCTN